MNGKIKCVDCKKEIKKEDAMHCLECGAIMCKDCRSKFNECEKCYDAEYCGM